jgi:hypothetical protein
MNERIKELMSQAFNTVHDNDPQWCIEYSKKFAELIIQECLDTIQRGIDNFGSHDPKIVDGGQYALFYTYRNIQSKFGMGPYQDQEHLGVEE